MNPPGAVPKLHASVLWTRFQHGLGAVDAFAEADNFDHLEGFTVIVRIQESREKCAWARASGGERLGLKEQSL
jgi:hypothetical protein